MKGGIKKQSLKREIKIKERSKNRTFRFCWKKKWQKKLRNDLKEKKGKRYLLSLNFHDEVQWCEITSSRVETPIKISRVHTVPFSLGSNTDNSVDCKYAVRVTITKWEQPKGEWGKAKGKVRSNLPKVNLEARKIRGVEWEIKGNYEKRMKENI